MRKTSKPLIVAMCALVAALGVNATYAWLTDTTEAVTNTFTVGNVDIDLEETTGDEYKMVPGTILIKDPKVTVEAGSEDCWLFVEVEKVGGVVSWTEEDAEGVEIVQNRTFDHFVDYEIADGWIELEDGVYYREVAASNADQLFPVLKDNRVVVLDTVTKQMMDAFDANGDGSLGEDEQANLPRLTFTAYAVQRAGIESAADAWAKL